MDILKYISLAAAAVFTAAAVAGCSLKKEPEKPVEDIPIYEAEPDEAVDFSGEIEADSYPDYPVSYPEIEQTEISENYESEFVSYYDDRLYATYLRSGFSGGGYIEGFGESGDISFTFGVNVPANQHYDISFVIAADSAVNCRISVNGEDIYTFPTMDDGEFKKITLYGVYLDSGENEITITPEGDISLDCMKIVNSSTVSGISYDTSGETANENAGQSARKLMNFLAENYGKKVITGQYAADSDNSELDLIYKLTGKYPVIRFAVLDNDEKSGNSEYRDIEACADWYGKGGIVGAMWQWRAPSATPSVYAEEAGFSLANAVTDYDISALSQEDIRGLYGEGYISEECYGIIVDIDNMSEQLLSLKNKGIPVIWRPLHEASLNADKQEGGLYWWGADGADAYRWLWYLMYNRMTYYHGLDNLIWVWNGMSDGWTVDKGTYDIASYDLYTGESSDFGSRYEQFAAAQKYIGSDKLLAISECDHIPDIDEVFRDNAVWSFFGLWYGEYLENENGEYSEKYTSKEELIRAYNSEGAITLDEYREMTAE